MRRNVYLLGFLMVSSVSPVLAWEGHWVAANNMRCPQACEQEPGYHALVSGITPGGDVLSVCRGQIPRTDTKRSGVNWGDNRCAVTAGSPPGHKELTAFECYCVDATESDQSGN